MQKFILLRETVLEKCGLTNPKRDKSMWVVLYFSTVHIAMNQLVKKHYQCLHMEVGRWVGLEEKPNQTQKNPQIIQLLNCKGLRLSWVWFSSARESSSKDKKISLSPLSPPELKVLENRNHIQFASFHLHFKHFAGLKWIWRLLYLLSYGAFFKNCL